MRHPYYFCGEIFAPNIYTVQTTKLKSD